MIALWLAATATATAAPVLMISVDGMKPEYVLAAAGQTLKIPYLRSLAAGGAFSEGVVGVWPTVTYPSHTTLLTGVAPAEHGIVNNAEFDPRRRFGDAWFWYANQIRVPTLWRSAHEHRLSTASVGWPVSVDAGDVDTLLPEFWRVQSAAEDENPADRLLIAALTRPAGQLAQMEARLGPYMAGNDTSLGGDGIKTRFALDILRLRKPQFMTIHLSSLDAAEHEHGPFSIEADRTLEAIDGMLSALAAAALANDPATIVVVVSDHGFTAVTHRVNLYVPFIEAGLMSLAGGDAHDGPSPRVDAWQAEPWLAGGMAAIMLRERKDPALEARVGELLRKLQANPDNGIETVLDRSGIAQRGGFPDAAFLAVLRPGYYAGAKLSGPLVEPVGTTIGGHGFSPELPDMRAAFFAAGRGIARHRDLGVVDMRRIAPTVAALLGVPLPTAKAEPLHLRP